MTNGYLEVAGAKLYFQKEGREDRPCVIFCNSLATNLHMWDEQTDLLADDYQIVRYDQRGHGKSFPTDHLVDFDVLAEDLLALMEHVSVPAAVLIGVSMGAVTVLNFAARYPTRTTRVIACDGQWKSPAGAEQTWAARISESHQNGMGALVDETLQRWFPAPFLASKSRRLSAIATGIDSTSPQGYMQCAHALQSYDLTNTIAGIQVPCDLVVGARDGNLPQVMRAMHAALAHSSFHEIEEAGHLPNIDQPERFNNLMKNLLSEAV